MSWTRPQSQQEIQLTIIDKLNFLFYPTTEKQKGGIMFLTWMYICSVITSNLVMIKRQIRCLEKPLDRLLVIGYMKLLEINYNAL